MTTHIKTSIVGDAQRVSSIALRMQLGIDTQRTALHAIIPLPPKVPFAAVPLPNALAGKQAKDVSRLLAAGYRETRYVYRAPAGQEIMAVCRFDKGSDKTFRPLRYLGKNPDGLAIYDLTAVDAPRPLYNLPAIAQRADATVLLVEGEKAADAAAARFPQLVCATWPGGAAGVDSADFSDIAGRNVVLWPDQDKAGRAAAAKLAPKLLTLGCSVAIVAVPETFPPKWDLADPDPSDPAAGPTPSALLESAVPIDPTTAAKMIAAAAPARARPAAKAKPDADVHRFFNAARFLGTTGKRNYGEYTDWFDLMCAAKNTLGEAGFAAFVALSCEYGGTDSEEEFRRKWDGLTERAAGEQKTAATFYAEAIASGWEDPSGGGDGGGTTRSDPASVVLEQSTEAGDILWLDQHGKPHVTARVQGSDGVERTVHMRVGSKRHKGAVSRRYRQAHKNKVLSAEPEKRAMQLLEHEAREGGLLFESANRIGAHAGCVFVDLCRVDGKAVRVAPDCWSVVDEVPVRFVRGNRGELPVPLPGGNLSDFEKHFNLSPADLVRVVAFVLGALSPLASFPILLIEGRQGTAKSTIGDMVLQLCDPPHSAKGGRLTMPRGEQNLLVHASGVRVVYIDNVSDVSTAEADSLCRLATGGGTSARQHYSDEDEVQLNAVRPTIVTCIGTPTGRGDFLDRCVRVTAQQIDHRRTEEAVQRAFVADQPLLLGFVLDALSASLRNKPDVDAKAEAGELKLARMADFAICAEGAAEVLGLGPGEFSAGLMDEQATMQAEGALGEPLGEGIARYFSAGERNRTVLEGHATEVLDELRNLLADPSKLPASNKLKGALRRIEPGLLDLGIAVQVREPTMGKRNRKTHYRISTTEAFQPIGEQLPF